MDVSQNDNTLAPKKLLPGMQLFAHMKSKLVMVCLTIISLGQWADSKQLIEDIYIGVVSNFSHHYEYESLRDINVGSNLDFVAEKFGSPQVFKKSRFEDDVTFAYYLESKFILTLILRDSRVSSYSIIALESDFVPYNLVNKSESHLVKSVANQTPKIDDYNLDYNNVEFILTRNELDKTKLFINEYFGSVVYGDEMSLPTAQLKSVSDALNINSSPESQIINDVNQILANAQTNFYGIGEDNLSLISDSILTSFEYSLYSNKSS